MRVKTFAALAFVKPDDVCIVYEKIVEKLFPEEDDRIDDFIDYFEKNFIGTKNK